MKIELDNIRAYFALQRGSLFQGLGLGDRLARKILQAWVDRGRPLVVVWGPPGSGKSTLLSSIDDKGKLVFETTGLNKAMNKFLLSLPRNQVTFVRHTAPKEVCMQRVMDRQSNPLDSVAYADNSRVARFVQRWFEEAQTALPIDKENK